MVCLFVFPTPNIKVTHETCGGCLITLRPMGKRLLKSLEWFGKSENVAFRAGERPETSVRTDKAGGFKKEADLCDHIST